MAHEEYSLLLTRAPNGGWIINENGKVYGAHDLVAAYSNKAHMLIGLSDLIDEREGNDDGR